MSQELELAKALQEVEPAVQEFVEATGLLEPVRELATWLAEIIHYRRAPHKARLLLRAADKIRQTGLPPRAVSDRLLRAVLEDGALEDDSEMQERWANLLAREATIGDVPPSFPEILRQLEPAEAALLDSLVDEVGFVGAVPVTALEIEGRQLDNLSRLGLVRRYDANDEALPPQLAVAFPDQITLTSLGAALVIACRRPAAPG
jgi:hypothetical protein